MACSSACPRGIGAAFRTMDLRRPLLWLALRAVCTRPAAQRGRKRWTRQRQAERVRGVGGPLPARSRSGNVKCETG